MLPALKARVACGILMLLSTVATAGDAQMEFRTPARLYGSVYSIKITLSQGVTDYTIPVWLRPDLEKSTLDLPYLQELGWQGDALRPDVIRIAGNVVSFQSFQFGKSDVAYPPKVPQVCCYGTLGRNVLRDFELKFDPQLPSAVEWKRVSEIGEARWDQGFRASWIQKLQALIQWKRPVIRVQGQSLNLHRSPYTIHFRDQKLVFHEPRKIPQIRGTFPRETEIFQFEFQRGTRDAQITSFAPDLKKVFAQAGLKKGHSLIYFDGSTTAKAYREGLERVLRGETRKAIELVFELSARTPKKEAVRKKVIFDFEHSTLQSVQPEPTPEPQIQYLPQDVLRP